MKLKLTHIVSISVGVLFALIEGFLINSGNLRTFVIITTLLLSAIPIMVSLIMSQKEQVEKEEKFLEFSRDLVENSKSGTPVVKGIINLQSRNYGSLTPHINKLANQLSLGITLTSALQTFARESDSKVISRAVTLISEAERAGGRIETILESVANSVNQIEKLRKERKSSVSNLVTQGYIIFFVFIIIMLVLEIKILPLVSGISDAEGLQISTADASSGDFSTPLFVMLIVQSVFAGLVIGKISDGSIKKGIRHSFILLATTLLITTGAKALFG